MSGNHRLSAVNPLSQCISLARHWPGWAHPLFDRLHCMPFLMSCPPMDDRPMVRENSLGAGRYGRSCQTKRSALLSLPSSSCVSGDSGFIVRVHCLSLPAPIEMSVFDHVAKSPRDDPSRPATPPVCPVCYRAATNFLGKPFYVKASYQAKYCTLQPLKVG